MTLDHAGKIVYPELYTPTHLVGRVAYPLFAGIVGLRLALSPELGSHYVRWLLPWALLSQPAYVLAGRSWSEGNILFTLLLGVVGWLGWNASREGRLWRAAGLLVTAVAGGLLTEYGLAGVVLPVAVAAIARRSMRGAILLLGPLGVLANFVPSPPFFEIFDLAALCTGGVIWLSATRGTGVPRIRGILFYAYYPAHLLALHWIDIWGTR